MSKSVFGFALGLALSVASVAPAVSQQRYATDPDPFIYSRLGQEHRALSHSDAVLPRTSVDRSARVPTIGPAYATDPDPFVYNRLNQEHSALSHSDATLPRASANRRVLVQPRPAYGWSAEDARLDRSKGNIGGS